MVYDQEKVKEELIDLILQITELDKDELHPDSSFVKDLGVDSLAALEILAALEKRYKIKIVEEELAKLDTLNSALSLVYKKLDEKPEVN